MTDWVIRDRVQPHRSGDKSAMLAKAEALQVCLSLARARAATSGYSLYIKDGLLVHDLNIGGGHAIS
jgi:hypothetical protein